MSPYLKNQLKTIPFHGRRNTHLSASPTLLSATIAFKTSAFAKEQKENLRIKMG
jgi:hypothetical protein